MAANGVSGGAQGCRAGTQAAVAAAGAAAAVSHQQRRRRASWGGRAEAQSIGRGRVQAQCEGRGAAKTQAVQARDVSDAVDEPPWSVPQAEEGEGLCLGWQQRQRRWQPSSSRPPPGLRRAQTQQPLPPRETRVAVSPLRKRAPRTRRLCRCRPYLYPYSSCCPARCQCHGGMWWWRQAALQGQRRHRLPRCHRCCNSRFEHRRCLCGDSDERDANGRCSCLLPLSGLWRHC